MPRKITVTVTLPTRDDFAAVFSRWSPSSTPGWILSRYATSLIVLTCCMSFALILSRDYVPVAGVTANHNSFWRILYACAFGVAALCSVFYYFKAGSLRRIWEQRLRTAMFITAMVPSLGWLLISVYIAVAFHGDWARVAPWVFIVVYFSRAFNTPATTLERSIIEEVRSHLPDS